MLVVISFVTIQREKSILGRIYVKIIAVFIHAYMLVFVYEILSEDKHKYFNYVAVLLIAGAQYLMKSRPVTSNLIPIVLCTILILYGMCGHGRNSNIENLKYALIAYGIDYFISIICGTICGLIGAAINTDNEVVKYLVINIGRMIIVFILHKYREHVRMIKKMWVLNIGVFGTIVLLIAEQIIRASFMKTQREYVNLAIVCTYLAALYTILWLIDHYKMAKIQKMYADDNKQMSQKLHRSKEILPMIAQYAASMDLVQDEEMRKKLEAICRDYGKELGGAEVSAEFIETTGIDLTDLLLRTKIMECGEEDIQLEVFVRTQIDKDMKRLDISDAEITRLLGDLLRNAIHAVTGLQDRVILLLIVRDENDHVLIQIFDTGIPFPPYVLERFGERGNTTWGTGNGLADMMETVKRAHASIEVNTKLGQEDVFEKVISICFDGKDQVEVA